MNFKINSRPLFTIIFKLKNNNFKTRNFSPLIERVLAGVTDLQFKYVHNDDNNNNIFDIVQSTVSGLGVSFARCDLVFIKNCNAFKGFQKSLESQH